MKKTTAKTVAEAYEALIKGDAVCELPNERRTDDLFKQLKSERPALDIYCVGEEDGMNLYQATSESISMHLDPKSFYAQEKLPNNVEHRLVMYGKEIVRDAYYVTCKPYKNRVEMAIVDMIEIGQKLKIYPKIAGLDIYYADDSHVQFHLCDDNMQGRDSIGGRLKATRLTTDKDHLVWRRRHYAPIKAPYKGITHIRGMFFGVAILT